MMRASRLVLLFAFCLITGCMVEMYGGNPRLQVANNATRWRVRSVGVGDSANPVWREAFDPLIGYGATTRVLEVPVAGRLRVFVEIRDSLDRDSVAHFSVLLEDGGFQKLEMSEDSIGRLRVE